MSDLSMSVGRDYNLYGAYEYCIYQGEKIIARKGFFKSYSAAKRAGLKAAAEYEALKTTHPEFTVKPLPAIKTDVEIATDVADYNDFMEGK